MSKEELAAKEVIGDVEQEKGPFSKAWQSSDAVLVVEEKELHVHSMILSLASPYFDKMFNGSFKESQTKRVTLEGKSYESVEQMITIIYPNMDSKFEFKTKLCNVCYPKAGNKRISPCGDCSEAKGINSLCTRCVTSQAELCPKCKNYYKKADEGRSQHFESLRSLFKLSEEYMVPTLSSIVENEVLSMSKSLEGSSNEYVMELLELADGLNFKESTDLCIKFLISRINTYAFGDAKRETLLRDLIKHEKIMFKTRNKLLGMMAQKKIGEVEEKMRQQLENENKRHRTSYSKCDHSYPVWPCQSVTKVLSDLTMLAKDMTA
ncbi:uncharacterized protein [Clytia hemisphaerica]|uniref:BTB domain-containing protein n=1 Tax=Clytia hemisphaerica TaxID=252671 RepID=A0A7M5VA21_9CNID